MTHYNLQSGEAIILKHNRVLHGGMMASYSNELILTNLHVILISKTVFGRIKDTTRFRVDQIKVHNGNAQALIGKRSNGTPQLEVYFTNGQEFFGFEKKRDVRDWIKAINQVVTGQQPTTDGMDDLTIPGTEFIASSIKDTFATVRDVFGIKGASVTQDCTSCGASITGFEGQFIRCNYCDTNQQL